MSHFIIYKHKLLSFIILIIAIYAVWVVITLAPFFTFLRHPFKLLFGEHTYLIILQNNYELRPTGGFISAFALLNIKNGVPQSLQFEDVYGTIDDHPYVAPPVPVGKLLAHPTYQGHTFRDANFNPHFPSSAAELESFLHKTRPFQRIDAVVAIDTGFLESWLTAVDSVYVRGKTFTSSNILEELEDAVSNVDLHDLATRATRKSVITSMGMRLVAKSLLPWNIPAVLRAVRTSLDDKHILIYIKDTALQQSAVRKNWAGELRRENGEDFLGVVDANYGGGKSNRYITRSIFYNIDLERGRASLDVRYDHPGEYALPLSTDYRSYVRFYVPSDHAVKGAAFSGQDGSLSFAGAIVNVPILSNRQLHFDMEFPRSTFDMLTYRLNLWKQPGTLRDFYHVVVRIPTGMRLESKTFEVRENVAVFKGALAHDKKLSFVVNPDKIAPRVIRQQLRKLNELELEWNEGIEPATLQPKEWRVVDTNTVNKYTDAVSIDSFEVKGRTLIIKTRGMTLQKEERYLLEIAGVRDFRDNEILKRTYTFYQRLVE